MSRSIDDPRLDAEDLEWREWGRKLRRLSPALYESVFALLVSTLPDEQEAQVIQ